LGVSLHFILANEHDSTVNIEEKRGEEEYPEGLPCHNECEEYNTKDDGLEVVHDDESISISFRVIIHNTIILITNSIKSKAVI
jgi:hypothetical protein